MEEKAPLCKQHKMDVVLICKTPKCKGELLCARCITTTHEGHKYEEIENYVGELISSSKETLSKVAKTCKGEERKQLIKWLQGKKREIEAEYENMIVQVSKFIIAKRNIHLKEVEQYLKSLKSNINPKLIQISKELINEGKNIINQNTMKKYAEVQRIAQNITKMRDELEQKMKQELKSDKSKLRAEIEGKILQNKKEFEEFRKLFLAQFKVEKDAKKIPEMKKLEGIEEFKGKQVTSAIHKSKKSPKEAGNNNYLHLLENKTLYMYNIREEKCIKIPITLNGVKKDIPDYSRYIELGGNIYLVGGTEDYTTSLKNTYISHKKNGEFEEISPMKAPRASHTLVSLYPHYIYAIGGWDREKGTQLSSCEVLDVRSQSWSDAPQLLKPKNYIGGCSFNNAYIYIFGGLYYNRVGDIEFLDCSLNTSWTSISTQLQHNLFPEICRVACAQIDSHNIIIYGGYIDSGDYQDKSFILDLNTMKIRELITKLKNKEEFENNNPVIYEDKIYNIGNDQNIHIFDIKSLEFDIIQENIWKK